jgi:hypothetical protein
MKPTTNPTGYATRQEPDLGPLFSPRRDDATMNTTPSSSPSSRSSVVVKPEYQQLPSAVDVAARVSEGRFQRILRHLDLVGPQTLDELCIAFEVSPNQISGRISDLKRDIYIVCTGQQRPTRSGCAADVYEITPAGRQYLQQLKSRSNRQGAKEQR